MTVRSIDPHATLGEQRYRVLACVMLGSIMGPIDASIVNVSLPIISQFFGVDLATAQLVPMTFLLSVSSLLLFHGRLGDIFGYKRIYMYGLGGFILGSALCALSSLLGAYWLIGFRALQGLAAGMMFAVSSAIITAAFPPRERGRALGINAISISAGLALGPFLGGLVADLWGWPFAFLINVPIGAAALLWGYRILPEARGEPARMDFAGAAAGFVCLFAFLLFVNRLQVWGLGWASAAAGMIALLSGVAFVRLEGRSLSPMLDLMLFRSRTFTAASASALLNYMSQYVMAFATPFYLQRVVGLTQSDLGLLMTAFPLATLLVAPLSGALSDRVGTRGLTVLGATVCAMGLLAMSRLPDVASKGDIAWRLALFGLGTGIFQSPNNSALMGSAPRTQLGVASGVLATVRNVGMALGIATASAVLYASVPAALLTSVALDAEGMAAFLAGLRRAYVVGAALTAAAAIVSLVSASAIGESRLTDA